MRLSANLRVLRLRDRASLTRQVNAGEKALYATM
jgi:hypothetical protein